MNFKIVEDKILVHLKPSDLMFVIKKPQICARLPGILVNKTEKAFSLQGCVDLLYITIFDWHWLTSIYFNLHIKGSFIVLHQFTFLFHQFTFIYINLRKYNQEWVMVGVGESKMCRLWFISSIALDITVK